MANDDSVGFGRPPKQSQFRPGQSGNPRGRPKGSRNILTDLRAELSAEVRITEAGQVIAVTKQRAIVKSLVAAAIDGNIRAVAVLLDLSARISAEDELGRDELSADERDILDAFKSKQQQAAAALAAGSNSDLEPNDNYNLNLGPRSGSDER